MSRKAKKEGTILVHAILKRKGAFPKRGRQCKSLKDLTLRCAVCGRIVVKKGMVLIPFNDFGHLVIDDKRVLYVECEKCA